MNSPPLIAIVGPTASGKSDLGIALAQRFNGEVINCDSVQSYRGLYIATAKVPPEEQGGIPHHLIDIVDPIENLSAVDWAHLARQTMYEIESRGKRPILVGGSGFYLRALTTKFCDTPELDESLRPRLMKILARKGSEFLHRKLEKVDSVYAATTPPKHWSRIIRALEVYYSSGIPFSEWQIRYPVEPNAEAERMIYFVLEPPREKLYERINLRADVMIERGLLTEIQDLIKAGVPMDAKAFQAHGYKRFVEYLKGSRTLESAIEQMKLDTRHYAKRQWSWWRGEKNTHWFSGFGFDEQVIEKAAVQYEER